jgi:hypothetical protein
MCGWDGGGGLGDWEEHWVATKGDALRMDSWAAKRRCWGPTRRITMGEVGGRVGLLVSELVMDDGDGVNQLGLIRGG